MKIDEARMKRGDAPGAPPIQVRIENISKTYNRNQVTAVESINLEVHVGEFVSLIGPSGCGKSTLLKLVAGLIAPTLGKISLAGSLVSGPRPEVGMMFQQPTLLPWRTAIENVLLPIEISEGHSAARGARAKAMDIIAMVGLEGFASAYPSELSGGMAQRVAICRMLITEPSILLLDEPFGALDELTRDRMNEELQRICLERNATTIMVTHSISEAVFLSDRVVVMSPRPGRIADIDHVNIDHPRTYAARGTTRFIECSRRVRELLDAGDP